MTQRILSIDSQILNTFQSCQRKCQLSFQQNLKPQETAEALEKGDLMHKLLEVYYSLQLDNPNFNTEVWKTLREAGIDKPLDEPHRFALKCAPFFASRMNMPMEEAEEVIYQFKEYSEYYKHDSWHPLAVEEVGSKVLYEDEELKVIYTFKIDLVAEQGRTIAPFDHKTSKRRSAPSSLSNQFIGYCYGLNLNNIVINKIGFQKTLSPKERFQRFILTISKERIQEWVNNTVFWARALNDAMIQEQWPMNLTSCDKYSGCVFMPVCESDPESRLYKIERDFKVNEQWDPAKVLEGK